MNTRSQQTHAKRILRRLVYVGLALALAVPQLLAAGAHAESIYKVWHPGSQDLMRDIRSIDGLDVSFDLTGPAHIFIAGHLDVMHRCISVPRYGKNYPIGVGVRLAHTGPNGASEWIRGSKWGPNIASCVQHYVTIPLEGYVCVSESGPHRISVWATAHTDATDYDGVAEVSPANDSDQPGGTTDPYNQIIVRVVATETCDQ